MLFVKLILYFAFVICDDAYGPFMLQTISYMAERVVGHGSFGVVFQVGCYK